ncbi:hypothetical protein ACF061_24770 [Streptomyces sp. NPDC015220]|uniref:hypothetical protein n=1 Tax=Streptomyces sp. NPDC015220 TaxID=3364947 RepID=UPI0036F5050F
MSKSALMKRALTVAGVGLAATALAAPQALAGTSHPNVSWYDGSFTGTSVVVNPTNVKTYGKLTDLANQTGGTQLWVYIVTSAGTYNEPAGSVANGRTVTGQMQTVPFAGTFKSGKITVCSTVSGGGCGTSVSIS